MTFLVTINDQIELEMLRQMFRENDIDCFFKHRESGAFMKIYMGMTTFGIDVYVPEENYEEAKALYDGFFSGEYVADPSE